MIILRNHFKHEDTYIVGDVVVNGYQTFHIDRLDDWCIRYNVPEDIKDQVVVAHRGNNGAIPNYDAIMLDENEEVRLELIKQVRNSSDLGIRKFLDIMVSSAEVGNRIQVVKLRIKEYLDILVNDENSWVKLAVAKLGIKEYCDILINDEDEYVGTVASVYSRI